MKGLLRNFFLGIVLFLPPMAWILQPHERAPFLLQLGHVVGFCGYALFALSLLLATRFRVIEKGFDGFDKAYNIHHQLGQWALTLLIIHPLLIATRFLFRRMDRLWWFFFPVHQRLAVNLGSYALWLMGAILLVTFLKMLSYNKWRITHKFLGVSFALATLHIFLLNETIQESMFFKAYFLVFFVIGSVSWIYKEFGYPLLVKRFDYQVINVDKLNDKIMEIQCRPKKEFLKFTPGQYVFASFCGEGLSKEAHPFTLCHLTREKDLKIVVKVLGDYTSHLYERLKPGYKAKIEGPYGTFNTQKGGSQQIWVAGGVGITPFLAWARTIADTEDFSKKIDLYYCIHDRSDAVHQKELLDIQHKIPSFTVQTICTAEEGHITASKIKEKSNGLTDKHVFLCGPKEMTTDLVQQFYELGVPEERIHYEDFAFM